MEDVALQTILAAAISLQYDSFTTIHYVILALLITIVFMLFGTLSHQAPVWCNGLPFTFALIPPKGKRLEDSELTWVDFGYVNFNRSVTTVVYITHLVGHLKSTNNIDWSPSIAQLIWVVPQTLAMMGIYDAVYVPFHRLLHVPALYPYIHKHHHHQAVPFRGTYDGINTHPVEFLFGIYLHFFSILVLEQVAGEVYGSSVALFLIVTGFMASLNHTRFGVEVPGVYDVRDHDVHHRTPRSNYGQFVMWWDRLLGTYKAYQPLAAQKTN